MPRHTPWLTPRGPTEDCEDVFVWMWYTMVNRLMTDENAPNIYHTVEGKRWQQIVKRRPRWGQ